MTSVPYPDNIAYTAHAVQQMDQRGIAKNVVEKALANGEVIEEYETDEEARYLVHWNEAVHQTHPRGGGRPGPRPDRRHHGVRPPVASG
ncbi:DUF4258 domain-containing protein [Salinibacter ruber]|uniref:DUF4258 domain-containing protein n=1 Tax=Salinibacter ruber TaxID=146919 RepID=UPI003C6E18BD